MSQLGMMVIAIGLSSYNIALFHLINHAFYKGLLFLGAGSVIHAVSDNQDFRKYGGLKEYLPLTYSVILIASLSLVAFPFMTGFYSKDFILESAYGQYYLSSNVVYFIAVIGAMFTLLYSVKVIYLTFIANPNGPLVNYKHAHEGTIFMSLPLVILAIFSIYFGYLTKDIYIGLGTSFFIDNSIFIHPNHEIAIDTEFSVSSLLKMMPVVNTIILTIISLIIQEYYLNNLMKFKYSKLGYNIFSFFNLKYLIELLYNKYIVENILKLGGQTVRYLDKGSIELIGPWGMEQGLIKLSRRLSMLDTGVVTSYALYILLGLVVYLTSFIFFKDYSWFILLIFVITLIPVNTIESDKASSPQIKNKLEYSNLQFQGKIPKGSLSSPKNNRNYSTVSSLKTNYLEDSSTSLNLGLNPWFVTGFVDAEGSFMICTSKSSAYKQGWKVFLQFGIALSIKDLQLLEQIKSYFGVGNIRVHKTSCFYTVASIKDLEKIINHFDNYSLISQKWSDYQLFKKAFELIKDNKHLTSEGLNNVISLKSSINLGLSEELKLAFPNLSPEERVKLPECSIPNPYWLSGFVSGEGCFSISIINSKSTTGKQIILMFTITQHSRDSRLMEEILKFLGCGKFYTKNDREVCWITVRKLKDLEEKIIPLFKNYPIVGIKALNLEDFSLVIDLMKQKNHLTIEGLKEIEIIKNRMNSKRIL